MAEEGKSPRLGALFMTIAAWCFVAYGAVFAYRNFYGSGFELGVETINGLSRSDLNAINPALAPYIGHLHVAVSGFIAATGLAVAALSWYGVRRGQLWAWVAAVAAPVVGLGTAAPMHYMNLFEHNWVTHLGPIYLATLLFAVGALLALPGVLRK